MAIVTQKSTKKEKAKRERTAVVDSTVEQQAEQVHETVESFVAKSVVHATEVVNVEKVIAEEKSEFDIVMENPISGQDDLPNKKSSDDFISPPTSKTTSALENELDTSLGDVEATLQEESEFVITLEQQEPGLIEKLKASVAELREKLKSTLDYDAEGAATKMRAYVEEVKTQLKSIQKKIGESDSPYIQTASTKFQLANSKFHALSKTCTKKLQIYQTRLGDLQLVEKVTEMLRNWKTTTSTRGIGLSERLQLLRQQSCEVITELRNDIRKKGVQPSMREKIALLSVVLGEYRETVVRTVSEAQYKESLLKELISVQEMLKSVKERLGQRFSVEKAAEALKELTVMAEGVKASVTDSLKEKGSVLISKAAELGPESKEKLFAVLQDAKNQLYTLKTRANEMNSEKLVELAVQLRETLEKAKEMVKGRMNEGYPKMITEKMQERLLFVQQCTDEAVIVAKEKTLRAKANWNRVKEMVITNSRIVNAVSMLNELKETIATNSLTMKDTILEKTDSIKDSVKDQLVNTREVITDKKAKLDKCISETITMLESITFSAKDSCKEAFLSSEKRAELYTLAINNLYKLKSDLSETVVEKGSHLMDKFKIVYVSLLERYDSIGHRVVEARSACTSSQLQKKVVDTAPILQHKMVDSAVWTAVYGEQKFGAYNLSKKLLTKAKELDDEKLSGKFQDRLLFPALNRIQGMDSKFLNGKASEVCELTLNKIQASIAGC